MTEFFDRFKWHEMEYREARELPSILERIEQAGKWQGPPNPMWDRISDATFNQGIVPDAAYATIPCLVNIVRSQPWRTDVERCLVLGYILDAVVGAFKGSSPIPDALFPDFDAGVRDASALAIRCQPSLLPDGLRLTVVAGRLLVPTGLVASYVVHGLAIQDVGVWCDGCGTVSSLTWDESGGWQLIGAAPTAAICAGEDVIWNQQFASQVSAWLGASAELSVLRELAGTYVCPSCGSRSSVGRALALAVKHQCPIGGHGEWADRLAAVLVGR